MASNQVIALPGASRVRKAALRTSGRPPPSSKPTSKPPSANTFTQNTTTSINIEHLNLIDEDSPKVSKPKGQQFVPEMARKSAKSWGVPKNIPSTKSNQGNDVTNSTKLTSPPIAPISTGPAPPTQEPDAPSQKSTLSEKKNWAESTPSKSKKTISQQESEKAAKEKERALEAEFTVSKHTSNHFQRVRSRSFNSFNDMKQSAKTDQSYHEFLGNASRQQTKEKHLPYEEKKKLMELKEKLDQVKGKDHNKAQKYEYRIGRILHKHGIQHKLADYYERENMRLDRGINAL